jgi:hypothetical protein
MAPKTYNHTHAPRIVLSIPADPYPARLNSIFILIFARLTQFPLSSATTTRKVGTLLAHKNRSSDDVDGVDWVIRSKI